jgi:hypothetical protein
MPKIKKKKVRLTKEVKVEPFSLKNPEIDSLKKKDKLIFLSLLFPAGLPSL